jgi:hypothetical protein
MSRYDDLRMREARSLNRGRSAGDRPAPDNGAFVQPVPVLAEEPVQARATFIGVL